eukprot:171762_1
MEAKTDISGLDDTEITQVDHKIELDENDRIFYQFKLKDNKIGSILRSTLIKNVKNPDCIMLCRFCGIDVGDGLKAKIDEKNMYYDSKCNAFTLLQEYINWEQFGVFKHWMRNGNLNIIGFGKNAQELQSLQRVCLFLGMDHLSKTLIDKYESEEYYNPMRAQYDNKQLFIWIKEPDLTSNTYHASEFVKDIVRDGYSHTEYAYWRKLKTNHIYENFQHSSYCSLLKENF